MTTERTPITVSNRRIRRAAARRLRELLRSRSHHKKPASAWGRDLVLEHVPRRGQPPLAVERRISIRELIERMQDPADAEQFLRHAGVGPRHEALYLVARGPQ